MHDPFFKVLLLIFLFCLNTLKRSPKKLIASVLKQYQNIQKVQKKGEFN